VWRGARQRAAPPPHARARARTCTRRSCRARRRSALRARPPPPGRGQHRVRRCAHALRCTVWSGAERCGAERSPRASRCSG
jgi:hypothetical protein